MHSWWWSSQDRTHDTFPSQSICASRSMAGGLPLTLLLLPGECTAFLSLASWKLSGAQRHGYIIFLFLSFKFSSYTALTFHYLRYPLFPHLHPRAPGPSLPRRLLVRSLSHSFSRYADAILLHNIIWWYIYTINDDRLKRRCVHVIFTI